ncbi:uncharacterized protein LOC123501010 [Portunus trituberculatus]|uniref:uncharacterized protein LOC123501010 n=1 Tax=Portunus trituberculatus TaxID=210409 RepID=UPI001E1CEE28|nr:uncharacterized protein LOC123501010 [Portunus trituberculatus]
MLGGVWQLLFINKPQTSAASPLYYQCGGCKCYFDSLCDVTEHQKQCASEAEETASTAMVVAAEAPPAPVAAGTVSLCIQKCFLKSLGVKRHYSLCIVLDPHRTWRPILSLFSLPWQPLFSLFLLPQQYFLLSCYEEFCSVQQRVFCELFSEEEESQLGRPSCQPYPYGYTRSLAFRWGLRGQRANLQRNAAPVQHFEKAFDMIRHEVLVERLRRLGVDNADIRIITNLYWGQGRELW